MQHVLNLDKSLSCLLFQTSFLLCKMVLYCAPRTIQNPQLIEPPANCCSFFFFFLSLCFHWVLSNEIIQESDLGESTLKICNMLYLCDFKKKKISQERIFGQQNSNEFLSSNKVLNLSRKIGVKAAGDGRGYVCRTVQGPGISFSRFLDTAFSCFKKDIYILILGSLSFLCLGIAFDFSQCFFSPLLITEPP